MITHHECQILIFAAAVSRWLRRPVGHRQVGRKTTLEKEQPCIRSAGRIDK